MALSSSPPQAPTAEKDLMTALSALHVGGKYSDLKIQCNYREWDVHKAIVCSRSAFFDGACSHPFREGTTGIIDLSEDDEEAVEQMIHYFYHLDYLNKTPEQQPSALFRHRAYSDVRNKAIKKIDLSQIEDPLLAQAGMYNTPQFPMTPPDSADGDMRPSSANGTKAPRTPPSMIRGCTPPLDMDEMSDHELDPEVEESTEPVSHLLLHTQVYALAEKYDIPALKELARRKFEMAAACYYDAPELADAVSYVYTTTIDSDRGLRDVVLQLFRRHPQLANAQDIFTVIKDTPSLALELWKVERGLL